MDRRRRRVLVGTAGVLGALAGCTGGSASLRVERVWFPDGGGENGQLAVHAEIANPSADRLSGTAYLYATVDGEEYVRRDAVSVDPGTSVIASASFPMAYEAAVSGDIGGRADVVVE
ncbi:hypothetical protein [Halocalculus aciditolerans]|uniref:Uncharacterized protein n=1 Tax=Halocalculus aciditolerans TaxID=1383812 RepID=A0A830F6Q1_9EURY|nr:hypothetical protein [Halocalculus aciditolerans]GGL68809.1 hypothetical protein GCM10009039_28480 [Halocalculus aciditolerans]